MKLPQLSWLRIGLRELFLLTVIAALAVGLWLQSRRPEFVDSGLPQAVSQALGQPLLSHGQVLSYSTTNTVEGGKLWEYEFQVTSPKSPLDPNLVWSTMFNVLNQQGPKCQCKLDSYPGVNGPLTTKCLYRWGQGRGVATVTVQHPSADRAVVGLVFAELFP
jgi:hypothetical protein